MQIKEIILGSLFVLISSAACPDTVKMGAVVLDDVTSLPMSDVEVCFSFKEDVGWRVWTESSKHHKLYSMTDTMGCCKASGQSNCGQAGCYVKNPPEGYYHPSKGWGNRYLEKNLFGVWQPDNLVATIRLQRVEHPIPLFVKYARPTVVDGTYDGTNAVLRYDLMLGDWLPPEGKGEKADLEVRTKMTINEVLLSKGGFKKVFFEFANEIDFPGRGNGCRSEMTSPTSGIRLRMAPDNDYANKMILRQGTRKMIVGPNTDVKKFTDSDPNRCYYFRVRSRFDDKGNLVEAFYGKIYGDFNFHGRWDLGFQGVEFLYYLNPTSLDRNLEWDMKTNLCPDERQSVNKRP